MEEWYEDQPSCVCCNMGPQDDDGLCVRCVIDGCFDDYMEWLNGRAKEEEDERGPE